MLCTCRPIYYSHTMASTRGTAKNYSGSFPAVPPIYAPPVSWTADQRHGLANSLLVEYQNTVDVSARGCLFLAVPLLLFS
eukprot:SAG11_NODE_2936_length_2825_cov_2.224138_2_plen_80_part_00